MKNNLCFAIALVNLAFAQNPNLPEPELNLNTNNATVMLTAPFLGGLNLDSGLIVTLLCY